MWRTKLTGHALAALALLASMLGAGCTAGGNRMNVKEVAWHTDAVVYQETFANPATWRAKPGELTWQEDSFILSGEPDARALFTGVPGNRPGGSVVFEFAFQLERSDAGGSLRLATNVFANAAYDKKIPSAVEDSITIHADGTTQFCLQDTPETINWRPRVGEPHEVRFVTVGRCKELWLDGRKVAAKTIATPWVCSEGNVIIETHAAAVRLTGFSITQAYREQGTPIYANGALLYADDFDGKTTVENWTCEHKKAGTGLLPPVMKDGGLRVDRFSAAWCGVRFTGPVVYEFEARPVPHPADKPDSITDAIFFFQADWAQGGKPFLAGKHYDAETNIYNLLRAYWMDFGGNGNATTRLRKLPNRQLLRQSFEPADMLKPNHVHAVRMVCAGDELEFQVDGRTVIHCLDPRPLTGGHFGVLGYVRGIDIRRLRVYRAVYAGTEF